MAMKLSWAALAVIAVSPAFAQAPTALTAKTATSKQVVLTWSGSASTYTIQRSTAGTAFATIGTASSATYTDSTIDPYTTYQYQVLNGSAASAAITVGPPPSGLSVAAQAPSRGGQPQQNYGYNMQMALDGNGDPSFAFLNDDPTGTGDTSKDQVVFVNWNRAAAKWNSPVVVATAGDIGTIFRNSISLAYDANSGVWGIAAEIAATEAIAVYTSPDGVAWTLKANVTNGNNGTYGPSLAMGNGNIYLAYNGGDINTKFVTGKETDAGANWITTTAPSVSGVDFPDDAGPSLALDSSGAAGVAYWCGDKTNSYNQILLFWRPTAGAAPVKVMTSNNQQTDTFVRLRYFGANPRVAVYVLRSDAEGYNGTGVHFAQSSDGGATWSNPVLIPPDGESSTDHPLDLALDSQNHAAIAFGENAGNGTAVCSNPKLAVSTDLTNWKTCGISTDPSFNDFGPYPGAIQAVYGANDKIMVSWWESNDNGIGTGILLYREPPAGVSTAPLITNVVNGATNAAGIVAGSWVTIYGANLAGTTTTWSNYITGDALPTAISGVQVKINGLLSAIYYLSPTQINVQAPANINGNVSVQVINNGLAGNTVTTAAGPSYPGLFAYQYPATNKEMYPAAVINATGALIGDPAFVSGSVKAKPGDIIQLYATGLGSSPAGNVIATPIVFQGTVTVTIGTATAQVLGAALTYPGEFQVNIVTPNLPPGDYPITIAVGAQKSQSGVYLPISN